MATEVTIEDVPVLVNNGQICISPEERVARKRAKAKAKKRRQKANRQAKRAQTTPATVDRVALQKKLEEKRLTLMAKRLRRPVGAAKPGQPQKTQKRKCNQKFMNQVTRKGTAALLQQLGIKPDPETEALVLEALRTGQCQNMEELVARLTGHQVEKEAKQETQAALTDLEKQRTEQALGDLCAGPKDGVLQQLPPRSAMAGLLDV